MKKKIFLKNLIVAGLENKISAKFIVKPINDTVVNIGQKSTKIHQKIENMVKKRSKNENRTFLSKITLQCHRRHAYRQNISI